MWIQRRTPSPSSAADTASSKSRAVAGSTVKVGEVRQVSANRRVRASRRLPSPAPRPRAPGGNPRRFPADPRAGQRPRLSARSAEPSRAQRLGSTGTEVDQSDVAGPHVRRAASERRLRSALEQRLGDGEAAPTLDARHSPRRTTPRAARSPVLDRRLLRQHGEPLLEALVRRRLRIVRRPDGRPDPLARQRGAVGGQVLPHGQVERPAGRRAGSPPGRCPCRRSVFRRSSPGGGRRAPTRGSRLRRPCRG